MSSRGRIAGILACLGLMTLALPGRTAAQTVHSNVEQVQIFAQPFTESLTLLVTPGSMNFVLIPNFANNDGDTPVNVSLDYVLSPESGAQIAKLSYYFIGPDALVNGSSVIPAANFSGQMASSGDTYFDFGSASFPAGQLGVFELLSINGSGTTVSGLPSLRVSTAGITLAPGSYSGTLFVQAQVH